WAFGRAAERYAAAFREHDLDVLGPDRDTVAGRLRRHRQRERLLAALEVWIAITPLEAERNRLADVLRAPHPDPDSFPNRWREALARKDKEKLVALAGEAEVGTLPADVLSRLGSTLRAVGAAEAAVRLLQEGQARHPGDFWMNFDLAFAFHSMKPPRWEEAI